MHLYDIQPSYNQILSSCNFEAGENGPEHPKIRRRELGPEEPLLDSVEGGKQSC